MENSEIGGERETEQLCALGKISKSVTITKERMVSSAHPLSLPGCALPLPRRNMFSRVERQNSAVWRESHTKSCAYYCPLFFAIVLLDQFSLPRQLCMTILAPSLPQKRNFSCLVLLLKRIVDYFVWNLNALRIQIPG